MTSENLEGKLQNLIQKGFSKEQTYQLLLQNGYKLEEINQVFNNLPLVGKPTKKGALNIDIKQLSASKILLFLGGLIMVIGGIIYIGINWKDWNQFGRILAIFLPMLITYLIGIPLWLGKTYQKQALFFIFTGSLLFPLFLYITFTELNIYKNSYDYFGFSISLISLIFYLAESLIFSSPVWSFLSPMAGVFVYYFGLQILGIDNLFKNYAKMWAYLVLATFYIFLAFYYFKKRLAERGKYPLLIGAALVVFSVLYILGSSFTHVNEAWLLLIFSLFYFILAIIFERNFQRENSSSVYGLSLITLFLTLGRLAVSGEFLKLFFKTNQISDHTILGGSILLAGIIYLFISYILLELKRLELEEPGKFYDLFEFLGTISILGGIFYMGLGGKKIIYETLLFISSLAFIFGSIVKQSRAFLYVGTLFLVIYIFDIGGEYFQNQVGWPLTLFIGGLISMGVGFLMEKLRRQYFNKTSML